MSRTEGPAIALIGFMGAGKTTLARKLSPGALDTDELVVEEAGMSVGELFATEGEAGFRKREEEAVLRGLSEAAGGKGGGVIALGGGSLGSARVRKELSRHTAVLLDVGVDEAWDRVQGSDRPLALDESAFRGLFTERHSTYMELADVVVPANGDGSITGLPEAIERLREARAGTRLIWAGNSSAGYPVFTGSGLIGEFSPGVAGREVIVTDHRVGEIHSGSFPDSLSTLAFPDGEASKTVDTCVGLWEQLADLRVTRADHIVALGGGVVGDVAGFVAATYQRGMPVVHWPTTLVAQVDSAYGGKTGVDLPRAKNYVGAYHQPAAVVTDVDLLASLPPREVSAGMAEVIKTALIAGGTLWSRVSGGAPADRRIIEDCALTKIRIVASDERDGGQRQLLNLGHTVAHALEAATGYCSLRHGEAVSIGLLAALRLSGADSLREQVAQLARSHGLPTEVDGVDPKAVQELVLADKKTRADGSIGFVLCESPGIVSFGNQIGSDDLAAAISEVIR